ncbi:MAG: lipoprotein signal peptidase [Pseudomonadales bacterium]|nr:lipoprotein signal peptidase [Pseudomonadales bacterium]
MIYFCISLMVVILDQATKYYMSSILRVCVPGDCPSIELLPVFQFRLFHNEGAAFSFLAEQDGWQRWLLVAVSLIVSTVVGVWLYRIHRTEKLLAVALALIIGGAVGNLIDRASVGYVVDFVLVHYQDWYFPAFNVADSSISVGAALLILDMFIRPKQGAESHA